MSKTIPYSCPRCIYNNRLVLSFWCLVVCSLWWMTMVTQLSLDLKNIHLPTDIHRFTKLINRFQVPPKGTQQINYDDMVKNTKLDQETRSIIKGLIDRGENISKIYNLYIESRRKTVLEQLKKFQFHKHLQIRNFSDLIPESGGQPIRSVLLATWRSGSSFLGDLLQTHPLSYYFYEPFIEYKHLQIRTSELLLSSLNNLKNILACNYTDIDDHIEFRKKAERKGIMIETHNPYIAEACQLFPNHCIDKYLMSALCGLYPFQIIKIVRLRVQFIKDLLLDESLNIRVLHLVRDPRGIFASRNALTTWCSGYTECSSPAVLCDDMVHNYYSFKSLKNIYPDRIKIIRYEDLVTNTEEHAKDIFDFLHLTYNPKTKQFIRSHTKEDKGHIFYSTYRDSASAAIRWMKTMNKSQIFDVQNSCIEAFNLWGYNILHEAEDLSTFQPFRKFNSNYL